MTRKLISSGSKLEADFSYSRAVVDGDWVFVSGTTGLDYATGRLADDVVEQAEQAFRTIAAALEQAGSGIDDVVRVQYTVSEAAYLDAARPVIARWFAKARPAATAVEAGLLDPRMKIEIEVTARKRQETSS